MKTQNILLAGLGVLLVAGGALYASGNLESLQGRFGATGGVTFSVSSSTPREDIVVAGTSDVPMATYDVTATKEDFVVTELAITNKVVTTDDNIVSVTLRYVDSDGNTQEEAGYLVSGKVVFNGLDLYVTKDDTAQVEILAELNTIAGGADAGDKVHMYLATTDFEAVGQTSGKTATAFAGSSLKNTKVMHVYETKPTLALDSTSPSGSRTVSASDDAFVFSVTADSAEKVDVQKLVIDILSDADFDTTASVTAYLKESGTTLASAPVTFTDASNAKITFNTTGVGEVVAADTELWVVNLDTGTLLNEDAGIDDPLTFAITYGTSSSGTVTAGGIWWSDTNAVAKWVGNMSSSTLTSNTVIY